MNHFFKFLFISVILSICAEAKIQLYLGVSAQYNAVHHRITFGEENYWSEVLLDNYQDALEGFENAQDGDAYINLKHCIYGTPLVYFKLLINSSIADFYHDDQSFNQFLMTFGGYLYRNHNILVSGEIYSGYTCSKITKQLNTNIFSGDAPNALKGKVSESSVQYSPASTERMIWFAGNIDLIQNLVIERSWCYGSLLRIGSIIKNRLYPFFCVGVELYNLHLKLEDVDFQKDAILMQYTDLPESSSDQTKIEWSTYPLSPKSSLEDSLVTFDKSKLSWGIMGGFGFEFFVNRHVSVRPQAVYAYSPDTYFTSDKGTHLKCESKYWKFSVGMFYRF